MCRATTITSTAVSGPYHKSRRHAALLRLTILLGEGEGGEQADGAVADNKDGEGRRLGWHGFCWAEGEMSRAAMSRELETASSEEGECRRGGEGVGESCLQRQ